MEQLLQLLPTPESLTHKGTGGRVLVVGGSEIYTGAPVFAAKAALFTGSDYTYILHSSLACDIKTFSPDFIVGNKNSSILSKKVSSILIGNGLSTDQEATDLFRLAVTKAKSEEIPLVIDADGLVFAAKFLKTLPDGTILTPNRCEYERLLDRITEDNLDRFIVIIKGSCDVIKYRGNTISVSDKGSIKRCSGIGDILAGVLVSLCTRSSDPEFVCETACRLVKQASNRAWEEHGYSMIADDVLCALKSIVIEVSKSI